MQTATNNDGQRQAADVIGSSSSSTSATSTDDNTDICIWNAPSPPNISRQGSILVLPSVRIRYRVAIIYLIILLISLIAAVEQFREFIINERALLTKRGREKHRTRRRKYDKMRMCDETDEPKRWQRFDRLIFNSEWRQLSSCVEYDLSLRKRQLGDHGVKRLVNLLERKEYATHEWSGRLRVLNLERQGITRRGAGYLARWIALDPNEVTNSTLDLVDVDRIPTAAFRSIYINLEGNPIGVLGVKDLERAVDKARLNGRMVVIVGGGSDSDNILAIKGGRGGQHVVGHQHVVKLGPIEYTRKSVEMPPWRLPVPWHVKVRATATSRPILPSLIMLCVFGMGVAVGRLTYGMNYFPYRLAIVRRSDTL